MIIVGLIGRSHYKDIPLCGLTIRIYHCEGVIPEQFKREKNFCNERTDERTNARTHGQKDMSVEIVV